MLSFYARNFSIHICFRPSIMPSSNQNDTDISLL
jgi:hypothetical protein